MRWTATEPERGILVRMSTGRSVHLLPVHRALRRRLLAVRLVRRVALPVRQALRRLLPAVHLVRQVALPVLQVALPVLQAQAAETFTAEP